MSEKQKVVVVMPAYNAARTLERTYNDIPPNTVDKVILVDDVSKDETVDIARQLGLQVIIHIQNRGYGGNQKTCYLEALREGADIVVMLHPDYQYDSTRIPALIAPIERGEVDMMIGSRLLGGDTLAGGMPIWKYVSNRFLTIVENLALGQHLSEMHSGFRAYSRRMLETIPFLLNSDDFVFDTEVIAQAVAFGFKIGEIAVPTRYFAEASSVNFRRSVEYGLSTLGVMRRFLLHRTGLRRNRQFNVRLGDIISRHYAAEVLAHGSLTSGWFTAREADPRGRMPTSPHVRQALAACARCVAVSAFSIWLLLRQVDLQQVGAALSRARVPLLPRPTAMYFVSMSLRAWRWTILLRPVKRLGWRQIWPVTALGYASNLVLPARLGEAAARGPLAVSRGVHGSGAGHHCRRAHAGWVDHGRASSCSRVACCLQAPRSGWSPRAGWRGRCSAPAFWCSGSCFLPGPGWLLCSVA